MEIKTAQELVRKHLEEIGYTKIETTASHAFIHLIEEVGEVARIILYKETNRGIMKNTTDPGNLEDEVADIFWQVLKLSGYLKLDLESCFLKKFEKNMAKNKK